MFNKTRSFIFLSAMLITSFLVLASELLALDAKEGFVPPSTIHPESLKIGQYLGAISCASSNCHGSVKPRDVYDINQNEYFTWLQKDQHTKAYNVLFNERSARIGRNINLKTKPNESPICLACHTSNGPTQQAVESDLRREGISCEGCHGPAGGWIVNHIEKEWTHDQSVRAGMTDLRNLKKRAETCLACHLGNAEKTVDHELIAAGHPRLIFELDNYSEAVPPHWKPLIYKREKRDMQKTDAIHAWAVGQAVAFRQEMLQLARQAQSANWPEFSQMDCATCHHSLDNSGWRQEQPHPVKAGFPKWSPARFIMLRHIVSVVAPEKQDPLNSAVMRLSSYISKINTPTKTVAAEATNIAEIMASIIPKIVVAPMDNAVNKKLLDQIMNDIPYLNGGDIHSVKQAVMGINTLVVFMKGANPALADRRVSETISALYDNIQQPENYDREKFSANMEVLKGLIK
ncbi:MAG: multiheme c-type cytochrome [Nitrospirota bacterium]